jgi:hypothetical protein
MKISVRRIKEGNPLTGVALGNFSLQTATGEFVVEVALGGGATTPASLQVNALGPVEP